MSSAFTKCVPMLRGAVRVRVHVYVWWPPSVTEERAVVHVRPMAAGYSSTAASTWHPFAHCRDSGIAEVFVAMIVMMTVSFGTKLFLLSVTDTVGRGIGVVVGVGVLVAVGPAVAVGATDGSAPSRIPFTVT